MKKRTVGVLLAAFFAMALTGCGDKQPQPRRSKRDNDKGEEYLYYLGNIQSKTQKKDSATGNL